MCVPLYGVGSTRLCRALAVHASVLWVNANQATLIDNSLHTFRPCLPMPSSLSSTGNRKVCDRFDTGRGPLYIVISLEFPTAKGRLNIFNAKFLSLMPQIQRIMAHPLRQSHCSSGLFSLPWSITKWTHALYTLPHILGERCLVVRRGKRFLNFPHATKTSDSNSTDPTRAWQVT